MRRGGLGSCRNSFANVCWGGDEDILQLHECCGAGFHCGIPCEHEESDRSNHTIGAFGDPSGFSGEDFPGSSFGVDGVVLADACFGVRMRRVDLPHVDAMIKKKSR